MTRTVGLLGGGVIGGGWAARFLLNGLDVVLYDPDPEAPRKIDEMLENARRAYGRLTYAPLPSEGKLVFAATPEEAVDGVAFVQESAPERIELKRELLGTASRVAPDDVVIASGTLRGISRTSAPASSAMMSGSVAPYRLATPPIVIASVNRTPPKCISSRRIPVMNLGDSVAGPALAPSTPTTAM